MCLALFVREIVFLDFVVTKQFQFSYFTSNLSSSFSFLAKNIVYQVRLKCSFVDDMDL